MKKGKRKVFCIILTMCLLMGTVMGCGSSSSESGVSKKTETNNSNIESKAEVQEAGAESKDSSNEKTEPAEANDQAEKETEKENNTKATYILADEVIVDDENCTFTITKAEEDKILGLRLKVFCENKTDKTLMFSWGRTSVNGYMVDPFWAEEVAAGKKSNEEIIFSTSALKNIGSTTADEIEFTLRVYDSDNWADDAFVEDTFTVYPTGLSSDAVNYPERRTTSTEQVAVDNEDVSFVILDSEEDSIWGYTLHCYLENKTDKTLMFSWDNVSVNGYMIDPFWAEEVAPGKRSYEDISFSKEEFTVNDINTVEEIEYSMRIYDYDNWADGAVFEETLTYNP